jgi:hypothetical protein
MYVPHAHACRIYRLARSLVLYDRGVSVSYLEHGRDEEGDGEIVEPVAGSWSESVAKLSHPMLAALTSNRCSLRTN